MLEKGEEMTSGLQIEINTCMFVWLLSFIRYRFRLSVVCVNESIIRRWYHSSKLLSVASVEHW